MILDLFAGHGWSVAVRALGLPDELGIEWDAAACATRDAAGMRTLQADIATLNPRAVLTTMCGRRPQHIGNCEEAERCGNCDGTLAGVPLEGLIASPPCQSFSNAGKGKGKLDKPAVMQCARDLGEGRDTRSSFDLHDDRSMLTVEPLRWALALRPQWVAFEQVPAVLPLWELFAEILASHGYGTDTGILHAEQYGVPQTRKRAFLVARLDGEARLPEPTHERYRKGHPRGQDSDLLPWVSMAEALGWDHGVMRSNYGTGGDPRKRGERASAEPAPTITGKVDRNLWTLRMTTMPNATERAEDEPAPTVAFGNDAASARWVSERPSTAVCADPRIMAPGRHDPEVSGSQMAGAIRVTIAEAATLQSYPADFPFQGSKTKQFQQIGNAVPPLLAEAVLAAIINERITP